MDLPLLTTWKEVEERLLPRLAALREPRFHACRPVPVRLQGLSAWTRSCLESPVHERAAGNPDALLNTLRYLFFHMRCGVLVSLRGNKPVVVAPFANEAYENSWSGRVEFEGSHGPAAYQAAKSSATRRPAEDWLPLHRWWMNGGVICNVMPEGVWGDAHLRELKEVLGAVCAERGAPDCDFFFNKRDYPQLRRDGSEPYSRFTAQTALLREAYSAYTPVLSFYGGSEFADCLVPLTEDWKLANSMGPECGGPWEAAEARAVWRGTATGSGTTADTNTRLLMTKHCAGRPELYDVVLTGLNQRDKVVATSAEGGGSMVVGFLQGGAIPRGVFLTLHQQASMFRFVLYADGHCAANRYGALMACERTILRVRSRRETDGGVLWLFPDLVAARVEPSGQASIPAGADHFDVSADLANLDATMAFLISHDHVARTVAVCARSKAPSRSLVLDAWLAVLQGVAATQALEEGELAEGAAWFSPFDSRYSRLGQCGGGESSFFSGGDV